MPPSQPGFPPFAHVLVAVKDSTDPDGSVRSQVVAFFQQQGISCETAEVSFTATPTTALITCQQQPDFIVVIGGDGTFLRTAREFADERIPMVGINRGNLGFLTRIETAEMTWALEQILLGHYQLESRTLLQVLSHAEQPLALNDVVVKSSSPSQMIRLELRIDGVSVAIYDADGLIIATPTGSTAYNLAAGGPVIAPLVDAVCITPICPHSLSAKPIVIPSSQRIQVVCHDRNQTGAVCSVDGQDWLTLEAGGAVDITRASHPLSIVNLGQREDNFYHLLKQKLQWSGNPRQSFPAAASV